MPYAYGVEYDTRREMVDIPPGKYWLVFEGSKAGSSQWTQTKKQIEDNYGKGSFRTTETRESQDEGETWIVIDVARPIQIDGYGLVSVSVWTPGDNAQNEGEWLQPPPSWIHTATDIVRTVESKTKALTSGIQGLAYAGAGLGLVILLLSRGRGRS